MSIDVFSDKIKKVMAKVQVLSDQIKNVKANIPVIVSGPEGKIQILQDSLADTLRRAEQQLYDPAELDKKYAELDTIALDVEAVDSELNATLAEYQIYVNCEYANWVGKLQDIGLNVKSNLNADYLKAMTLEQRIEAIKQTLDAGRTLSKDAMQATETNLLRRQISLQPRASQKKAEQ